MSATNHQDQEHWPLEAPIAALEQAAGAQGPTCGSDGEKTVLTAQDEALLHEIECGDSSFIDQLVDGIWDAKNWEKPTLDCLELEDAEDVPLALPELPDARPAAEQSAHRIVYEWAAQVSHADLRTWLRRKWDRSHTPRQYDWPRECFLLLVILGIDDDRQWRALRAWANGSDDRFVSFGMQGCTGSFSHKFETLRWRRPSQSPCSLWKGFLRSALSPKRNDRSAALWTLVERIAETFHVRTYDRENILRVLLGNVGSNFFFLDESGSEDCFSMTAQRKDDPKLLQKMGSAVVEYFREYSIAVQKQYDSFFTNQLNGRSAIADQDFRSSASDHSTGEDYFRFEAKTYCGDCLPQEAFLDRTRLKPEVGIIRSGCVGHFYRCYKCSTITLFGDPPPDCRDSHGDVYARDAY